MEFVSFGEQIDKGGPLGQALMVIVGAIAELERSLITERVRAGPRRALLEGRRIGRLPLPVDREATRRDRQQGMSPNELARTHHLSKATICKIVKRAPDGGHKGCLQPPLQPIDSAHPDSALQGVY